MNMLVMPEATNLLLLLLLMLRQLAILGDVKNREF
jgi:hypothetical protein